MNSILRYCANQSKFWIKNSQQICRQCQTATTTNASNPKVDNAKGRDGHYDLIIVGGGTIGLSMACSIGKNSMLSDKKVLLLDAAPPFKGYSIEKYSNRVFSISDGTVELMKTIGAWDTIASIRHQPIKQMQVWDALSDAYINFNHEHFSKNVAYVVENDVILHAVIQELNKMPNVLLTNKAKIEKINLPDMSASSTKSLIRLESGEEYSCEMLIGADGANSLVRKEMNVDNVSFGYDQMGVIATVELEEAGNNNVAWQRFLPDGVLALLPLSDSLSSIVWSTEIEKAKNLLSLPEDEFIDNLNHAFWKKHNQDQITKNIMKSLTSIIGNNSDKNGPLPPKIKSIYEKSRAGFPLGFGHASSYIAHGAALIGDSAHRVHPLAGQGLNLGFGDVKDLTDILAQAAYDGAQLGDAQHLTKYEQTRLLHNVPIMLGIHGLQKLYGTDFGPLVLLRSVGLQMTHALPPIKKIFMEKAMY